MSEQLPLRERLMSTLQHQARLQSVNTDIYEIKAQHDKLLEKLETLQELTASKASKDAIIDIKSQSQHLCDSFHILSDRVDGLASACTQYATTHSLQANFDHVAECLELVCAQIQPQQLDGAASFTPRSGLSQIRQLEQKISEQDDKIQSLESKIAEFEERLAQLPKVMVNMGDVQFKRPDKLLPRKN